MMKEVKRDGKTILLFEDREELKWYFHAKICRGEQVSVNEHYMNKVWEKNVGTNDFITIKQLNAYFENTPYRIKDA